MGQRNEVRQKPPNGQRKGRAEALVRLKARSEDRSRAALLFDSCVRQLIAAKFNSLLELAPLVCTMRNDRFVNAFRILNIDREWQATSPVAVAERRRSNRLLWIFGIVLAVFEVWDVLHDFFK